MARKLLKPITLSKLGKVKERTKKSRSSIYAGITDGTFPAPIKTGRRSVAWIDEEIDLWIAEKIAESRPSGELK